MQKKVVPMFHVPDVQRTVDWYKNVGFAVKSTYDDGADGLSFAIVAFGDGEVMFSSGGQLSAKRRRDVDLYAYTDRIDDLYDRLNTEVEIIEGPHNMFYGMREIIVRDLNGFWVTFGQEIPADELTPWPAIAPGLLEPYAGKYASEDGGAVLITVHEGRLLAFPDDAPGVFLMPADDAYTFTPVMTQAARVSFQGGAGQMTSLAFEQDGKETRFARVV